LLITPDLFVQLAGAYFQKIGVDILGGRAFAIIMRSSLDAALSTWRTSDRVSSGEPIKRGRVDAPQKADIGPKHLPDLDWNHGKGVFPSRSERMSGWMGSPSENI
jgi:hypothetical protein